MRGIFSISVCFTRVNIFLTGKSYTTFRDKDHWYDQAVVNVMGAEHKYDNRGLGKRVMFQIAIKGIMDIGHSILPINKTKPDSLNNQGLSGIRYPNLTKQKMD